MYTCVVCVGGREKFSLRAVKMSQVVTMTTVHCVCVYMHAYVVCVREKFSLRAVKMSHLSAAACQDVPSFGKETITRVHDV